MKSAPLRRPDGNARMSVPAMQMRECKVCKDKYMPERRSQRVCGYACAIQSIALKAEKKKAKAAAIDRKETKEKLEKFKTRSDYIKEAQIAFNRYIRLRDFDKPCICCGTPLQVDWQGTGGAFDCGHYRSVGSAPHLRFDERNAHGQSKKCNRWGSGRAVDYRIGLINRLGIDVVNALEADQTTKHYSIEDLKAIKSLYKLKVKELSK